MLLIVAVLFGKDKENGGKNLEVCRNFECTGEITKMESVMNIFLKERKSLSGHSEAISLIIITKRTLYLTFIFTSDSIEFSSREDT